jgi:predicted phage terminase large subunit-like protein
VYDLTVEHDHEFFAEGLLVANCIVWAEELAAWVKLAECWDQMRFCLRLGSRPHVVVSTTPKPRKKYIEIRSHPDTVKTGASTLANPHLDPSVREALFEAYGDTRLGRQELNAELLLDVPGALWTYASLEDRKQPPNLVWVTVAIDPAATDSEDSDETGIVVGARGDDGRGYVLDDRSGKASPAGWARRALQAYDDHEADTFVAEVNNGGDMVEHTLRTEWVSQGRPGVLPYRKVHASRGKQVRAQPVAALYEQGRVSHVGVFSELEEQMTTWTPESGRSPDRLDALVYALTDAMLGRGHGVKVA